MRMADYWNDSNNYMQRHKSRLAVDAMRERRRAALQTASKISYQITTDGQTSYQLVYDTPPTLNQLIAEVGPDACVVSVGRYWLGERR